ncbi:MAG: DUF401 family protein [Deltaproteobacteria bacterium]|jgi:integral membrane protein (TIGR00529 family)|nr:DUF401 family protein [Deltaproteobacteria bacterium]
MPELSVSTWAIVKLVFSFGLMLLLLRKHRPLWLAICAGSLSVAVLCRMPWESALIPFKTAIDLDFLLMLAMLSGILLLSGLQNATGQSRRLVEGLERCIRWPRVRLVFFPALVGLLPMPGGAYFSCPMLDNASRGIKMSPQRKSLINYWFRHIWEGTWPLYPGCALASSLLGISLLTLLKYTLPFALLSFLTGWFFFMRGITPADMAEALAREKERIPSREASGQALKAVAYESLPLLITLLGAALFGAAIQGLAPEAPAQLSFVISVCCGVLTAYVQGRRHLTQSVAGIFFTKTTLRLLLVIFAVYIFKDIIGASGLISQMSEVGSNPVMVLLLCAGLAFCAGLLTGVMVGLVGLCFPILLGVIAKSGLGDYTIPLAIFAMVCGNAGMLLTPVHICLALTCEYFKIPLSSIWRSLLPATGIVFVYGSLWCLLLAFLLVGF